MTQHKAVSHLFVHAIVHKLWLSNEDQIGELWFLQASLFPSEKEPKAVE